MKIAKTLLKVLAWSAIALVVLVVAAYAFILGINWHDRPPSEAALRLETAFQQRPAIRDEDNGFVYLMGFAVAESEDPSTWGRKRIAWAHQQASQTTKRGNNAQPGEDISIQKTRTPKAQALLETCKNADRACLTALESSPDVLTSLLNTDRWLLNRYRTLLRHPEWQETLPFDIHTLPPSYLEVLEAQKVLFAHSWHLATRADAAGVKKLLGEDVRFWRLILEASEGLLSKLIATAALERHFAWGNIILRQLPPDLALQGIPEQWQKPISQSERSLMGSFVGEWALLVNTMQQIADRANYAALAPDIDSGPDERSTVQRFSSLLIAPLFQPQDTINQHADMLVAAADTLQVPYEQYPAVIERARAQEAATEGRGRSSVRIYNYIGNVLSSIATPDYLVYGARVADLEGVRCSALLASELRSQGIMQEDVHQHLSEAALRNPYSGKPFLWDVDAQAIVFTGLAQPERRRHVMLY